VVRLVVEGLTNLEIAGRLNITERTVQAHVTAARAKLVARSRTQLAVVALRRGIVPLEPFDG
jgi:DNA-binding NarL/FixJ family response regulator